MPRIELGINNPKRFVAVFRRVAFVAIVFFVCTNTLDVKRSVVPLIFGVLLCGVLLYEHGFKLDANRRNRIWFIIAYLVPMAVMIVFISVKLLRLSK
jgi:hypothetical protein